jgi:hypothetical protein
MRANVAAAWASINPKIGSGSAPSADATPMVAGMAAAESPASTIGMDSWYFENQPVTWIHLGVAG